MTDTFEFTLNNPLTEEQWDQITDVDFDNTYRIWFHTKNGKEVEFAKVIRCKDCKHYCNEDENYISEDGFATTECIFMPTATENDFCSRAERKEE